MHPMKRLYLIRHAKSSWSDGALTDFERGLNGRGKRDAPMMGERLAAAGVRPALMISSPARRARKTAVAIAERLGYAADRIVLLDALYTFDRAALLAVVGSIANEVESLALVGHNNALTEAASWLIGEEFDNVPTCGVVAMQLPIRRWSEIQQGSGTLEFYDFPKRPQPLDERT